MNSSQQVLNDLLDYLKISANKLALEIGLKANTAIYHVKNGRNNLSAELANKITSRYPEINYSWLLTGDGEMLNTGSQKGQKKEMFSQEVNEPEVSYGDLRAMHQDIKQDLKAMAEGMTGNFAAISEAMMASLQGQRKILDFVEKLDAEEIKRATGDLKQFLKQQS